MPDGQDGFWIKVGAALAAVSAGFWFAMKRILAPRQTPTTKPTGGTGSDALPPARVPATADSDKRVCYAAFVNGMENRQLSFTILQVLNARDRAAPEFELLRHARELADTGASEVGAEKALRDLHYGDFVQRSRLPKHWEIGLLGRILLADHYSLLTNKKLASDPEQQLRCFDGVLGYAAKSSTFLHVLLALMTARSALTPTEVHQKAVVLIPPHMGKQITVKGVQNLLQSLTRDPFVDEYGTEKYTIHNNGRILLQCIAERRDAMR